MARGRRGAGMNRFEDVPTPGGAASNPFDPCGSVLDEVPTAPLGAASAFPVIPGGSSGEGSATEDVPMGAGDSEDQAVCEMERVR